MPNRTLAFWSRMARAALVSFWGMQQLPTE
jgi:hypothetical protein